MVDKVGDVKITVDSPLAVQSKIPVMGDRRLVRMLPCGLPGVQGRLFPCVWMSDYVFYDADNKENSRICLVLVDKGTPDNPRPNIVGVTIPAAAVEKFPLDVVEW